MGETLSPLAEAQAALGAWAPHVMLGAGVLLLVVPRWLRVCIAVALIALGLAGIRPDLVSDAAFEEGTAHAR